MGLKVWVSKADSAFMTYYSALTELINGAIENLRNYRKFGGALDL